MMKKPAFVAEWAVVVCPALNDKIERFPVPLVHPHRIAIRRQDLIRHAPYEPGLQATVRKHIYHRHLFGDANRLPAVGDRIAEN
jgi:hypothetical protein